MKTHAKKKWLWLPASVGMILILAVSIAVYHYRHLPAAERTLRAFAWENQLSLEAWPQELLDVMKKNPEAEELKYEIADFLYHLSVLMVECNLNWDDVMTELAHRR